MVDECKRTLDCGCVTCSLRRAVEDLGKVNAELRAEVQARVRLQEGKGAKRCENCEEIENLAARLLIENGQLRAALSKVKDAEAPEELAEVKKVAREILAPSGETVR